jgi:hypothetical protein
MSASLNMKLAGSIGGASGGFLSRRKLESRATYVRSRRQLLTAAVYLSSIAAHPKKAYRESIA